MLALSLGALVQIIHDLPNAQHINLAQLTLGCHRIIVSQGFLGSVQCVDDTLDPADHVGFVFDVGHVGDIPFLMWFD